MTIKYARYIHTISLGPNPNKMKCVQWIRQFLDISLTEALAEFHQMEAGKVIVRDQEPYCSPQWMIGMPWPCFIRNCENDVSSLVKKAECTK